MHLAPPEKYTADTRTERKTSMKYVDESGRFISIATCPFMRRGSWLGFYTTGSEQFGRAYLYLASHHGIHEIKNQHRIFDVQPLYEGERVPFAIIQHTATELLLRTLYGDIRICWPEERLIYFQSSAGLGLRFATARDHLDRYTKPRGKNAYETQFTTAFTTVIHAITGTVTANAPWVWDLLSSGRTTIDCLPDAKGTIFCSLEEFTHSGYVRDYYASYEEGLAAVTADWEEFNGNIPHLPGKYDALRELCAYNLWSYLVSPAGFIKRPYLFMGTYGPASQWQTSYQAIAFANNTELGWDQMLVSFDYQSETGQLPDFYSDNYGAFQNIRPPIQGWALKMMRRLGYYDKLNREKLADFYPKLEKWANWFGKYRTDGVDGLPQYEHSDESGMEDGSTFRESCCMVTPDLPAYLILLFEELGEISKELGMDSGIKEDWDRKASDMQKLLIDKLWNGERFVSHTLDGKEIDKDYCILGYMPVLLGKRLPEKILTKLIADLKEEGVILTDYGFAKEKMTARDLCDIANNGVRGMIYHPFNLMLISALYDCGEKEFAAEAAKRYCGEMLRAGGLCHFMNGFEGGNPGGTLISWTAGAYLLIAGYIS